MGVFDGSPHYLAYMYLDFFGTFFSTIASIVTILVINKMKITGYIKLILTMTWFQLLYDASFFNGTIDVGEYWITYIANIFQLVGGIGSSLISNWIAFVVLYVVYNKRSLDIMGNYNYMLASALIPSFVTVVVYSIGAVPQGNNQYLEDVANLGLYYYTRLISIFLNFLMFGLASYFNYKIRSKGLGKSPSEQAINTLCRRLIFYPLFQAISRSGFAWYEFQYGYDFEVSNCVGDSVCYTALIYAVIITPTVSFGYLALFLRIEPHAYTKFRSLFGLPPSNRSRFESKDTMGKIDSSVGGSDRSPSTDPPTNSGGTAGTTGAVAAATAAGAGTRSATSFSVTSGSRVETDETLTSSAYAARESSMYQQQVQMVSYGWAGSSIWKADAEEADERDEAALLESIDSESHIRPPSMFRPSGFVGYDADIYQNSLSISGKNNSVSGRSRQSPLDINLQSSTTSPMVARLSFVKDLEQNNTL